MKALFQGVASRITSRTFSSVAAPPPMTHILSSLKLGDLNLRNRVVMASLTRNRSVPDTVPNEYNVEYYTQRAQGGAGLILSEATLIAPQGTEWPTAPGIWSEDHVSGWKKVTDSVHQAGASMFCQVRVQKTRIECDLDPSSISSGTLDASRTLTCRSKRKQESLY